MRPLNILDHLTLAEWLESLLPDFVLAFAFFTSAAYAVLGKRFEKQRPAIVMSAAIGLSLSIGLVWWEQANSYSIRDLGPIAVGFALLVLSLVMYQSVKLADGSWAGAGITIGACIIIAQILGVEVLVDHQAVQTITTVALLLGIFAFLMHTQGRVRHIVPARSSVPDYKAETARLYRDRHLSENLTKRAKKLKSQADQLNEHPEDAGNVMLQIKRMLPAEGYLTQRMAQLRTKAHQIRNGHIARLEETRQLFKDMPTPAKKKASADLSAKYNELIGIDTRLERLDNTAAENERRIRELTARAQALTARYDYKGLHDCIKVAEKLQHHNSHLFKIIERTEKKLSAITKQVSKEVKNNAKTNG